MTSLGLRRMHTYARAFRALDSLMVGIFLRMLSSEPSGLVATASIIPKGCDTHMREGHDGVSEVLYSGS
jgi:hypothetical protein